MVDLVKAEGIEKVYHRSAEKVYALRDLSFTVSSGEFLAISGPSGSGKSTLLHILGCLDRATSGKVYLEGVSLQDMDDRALAQARREKIGFVFQQFYLLPGLTVAENVSLPLLFSKKKPDRKHLEEILDAVGLSSRKSHLPRELSGGEMQRVAIARALINRPRLLMADEPTANLDSANSEKIFLLLEALSRQGITVILVTHNEALARRAGRQLHLLDGRLVDP